MEITDVLNKSKLIAINSFKNFCKLLHLDPNLFNHIFNIEIKIGDLNKEECLAIYNPKNFCIIISEGYLFDMVKKLKFTDSEKEKKDIYLDITLTLLHEMIHANRTIMIERGINAGSLESTVDKRIINENKKNISLLEQYRKSLNQILKIVSEDEFKKFIPIMVKNEMDDTLTIVAYNKTTKKYVTFEKQKFNSQFTNGMIKEYIMSLGNELNNIRENHIPDSIISDPPSYYENYSQSRIVSDYYSKSEKLVDKNKKNEFLDDVLYRIDNQNDFEEVVTETLAIIMMNSRNMSNLDLDLIRKHIEEAEESIDIRLCTKFLCNIGIDAIKQFMISVYDSNYSDNFEKVFKEEYDNLLASFSEIYSALLYDEVPDQISISDANSIIENKTGKSR